MFIIMVFIVHAASEWVEISQQHYRKPVHNNFNFHGISETYFEEATTKANRVYDNRTITEHTWQKGNVDKVPKLGSVQRVQLDANVVKAPNIRGNVRDAEIGNDASKIYNKEYHDVTQPSANIVKETGDQIELKNFFQTSNEENSFNPDLSSTKKLTHTGSRKTAAVIPKYSDDIFNIKTFNEHVPTEAVSTSTIEIFTNPKRINQYNDKRYTNTGSYINRKKINTPTRDDNEENKQFVTQVHSTGAIEDFNNNRYADSELPENPFRDHKEQTQYEKSEETNDAGAKVNTIESVLNFMKIVSDTIRRNTRRSVSSKTRYLQNLKDTILANIEERIESTWPDDEQPVSMSARQRREARGHLEVPSSESALMTISFLTFAVFLIKLVLQVIQTYKNKAMMVTPAVVATVGRVAAAARTADNRSN